MARSTIRAEKPTNIPTQDVPPTRATSWAIGGAGIAECFELFGDLAGRFEVLEAEDEDL